ncbi:hypothetical protein EYF80_018981 [Liparis tanakae]|uniref:Uncharacterized protein n=1 Tax=Liparis tanakae TaxID=230148 RepID=A0A4Z2HYP0_9TELE|nr:hypothetical protein EYF80_018981 [Liparis tanakae]
MYDIHPGVAGKLMSTGGMLHLSLGELAHQDDSAALNPDARLFKLILPLLSVAGARWSPLVKEAHKLTNTSVSGAS